MLTHKIGISVEKYMINGQFLNDINSSGAISNFEIFFILVLTRDFLLLGFTFLWLRRLRRLRRLRTVAVEISK